jgi:phage terminase small subunit
MAQGKKLTPRQARFVEEFLTDLNASAAYRRAGYSATGHAAEVAAARLMRNVEVAEAITKAMAERAARTEVSADRVLCELAKIAFFDVRKALNNDGSFKSISELDDDTAAALASFDVVELGGDVGGVIRKVRLVDRLRAIELLGKHLGLFSDRIKVSGDVENPLTLLIRQVQGTAFRPVPLRVVDDDECAT